MADRNPFRISTMTATFIAMAILVSSGCTSPGTGDPSLMAGSKPSQAQATQKGGAQLWAENCLRCHNSRSPSAYSDGEWDIVMHHMRVRANLTAEEHRIILAFLKASN